MSTATIPADERDEHLARAERSLALLDEQIDLARAAVALAAAATARPTQHRRPRPASATTNSERRSVLAPNGRPVVAGRK